MKLIMNAKLLLIIHRNMCRFDFGELTLVLTLMVHSIVLTNEGKMD